MKKTISILLAFILVLSLATVAFAADKEDPNEVKKESLASEVQTITFYKDYAGNAAVYPSETLKFEYAAPEGAPEFSFVDVASEGKATNQLSFQIGEASTPGKYTYTFKEVLPEDTAQGVIYTAAGQTELGGAVDSAAATTVTATVLVSYRTDKDGNYIDADGNIVTENSKRVLWKTVTLAGGNTKINAITNQYNVGSLSVQKTISGNLASATQYFDVTVKLNATNKVLTDISVSPTTNQPDFTRIEKGWTGEQEFELKLKADETIRFDNIPAGVTYTVYESSRHLVEDPVGSNPATGYEVKVTGGDKVENNVAAGTIDAAEEVSIVINNDKDATVATGVITDSAPYIVLIAVCAVAAVLFVIKRRNSMEF